jgi:hypothetical protein
VFPSFIPVSVLASADEPSPLSPLQMGSWKGTTVQDSKRAAFVHAAGRAVTLPSCDHCDLCLLQNLFLLYCNYNKLPLNWIFFLVSSAGLISI